MVRSSGAGMLLIVRLSGPALPGILAAPSATGTPDQHRGADDEHLPGRRGLFLAASAQTYCPMTIGKSADQPRGAWILTTLGPQMGATCRADSGATFTRISTAGYSP